MNRYEIRVKGHLDARRADALGAESLRLLSDGTSVLVVSAVDQAATYGLLARLRDAGLELLALRPFSVDEGATSEGSDRS